MPTNQQNIDTGDFAVVTDRYQKNALLNAIAQEGWTLLTKPGDRGPVMFRSPERHRKSFVAFLGGNISHYTGSPEDFRIIVGNTTVGILQMPPVFIEYLVTKGVIPRDLATKLFRYAGKSIKKNMYQTTVPLANARDASLVQEASASIIPLSECRHHAALIKQIIEEDWVPTYIKKAVRFVDPKNTRRVVAISSSHRGRHVLINGVANDGPNLPYSAYENLANYAAQWDPRFKKVLPTALSNSTADKSSVYAIKDTLDSIVRGSGADVDHSRMSEGYDKTEEELVAELREPYSEDKIQAAMRFMNKSAVASQIGVTGVYLNQILRNGGLSRQWRWRLTTFLKSAGVE